MDEARGARLQANRIHIVVAQHVLGSFHFTTRAGTGECLANLNVCVDELVSAGREQRTCNMTVARDVSSLYRSRHFARHSSYCPPIAAITDAAVVARPELQSADNPFRRRGHVFLALHIAHP
jgi:hypothetical protein